MLRKYKIIFLCITIYVFHISVSHFILPYNHVINFFPFYDWNLFSYNPSIQTWPMIRIIEIDHTPVEKDNLIYHNGIVANAVVSGWVPEQMNRFLHTLNQEGAEANTALKYRKELEENLFHNYQHVKYEFFPARINVRDFFHRQEILESHESWKFEYLSKKDK